MLLQQLQYLHILNSSKLVKLIASIVTYARFMSYSKCSNKEYWNCLQTDVYLLFAIWMGPIQSNLIYVFVTYGLYCLKVFDKFVPADMQKVNKHPISKFDYNQSTLNMTWAAHWKWAQRGLQYRRFEFLQFQIQTIHSISYWPCFFLFS